MVNNINIIDSTGTTIEFTNCDYSMPVDLLIARHYSFSLIDGGNIVVTYRFKPIDNGSNKR